MGEEVITEVRMDQGNFPDSPTVASRGIKDGTALVAPKVSARNMDPEYYEVKECTAENQRVGEDDGDEEEGRDATCRSPPTVRTTASDIDESISLSPNSNNSPAKQRGEEDDCSVISSIAISARTMKSLTVGTAPTFRCTQRAEKRKEFYTKLEQKHQALEEEKNQAEARTKEEQATAIRVLRKNMVFRANPVPSFYHEGHPPKVELKKVPPTRAVSPKFGRRRSYNDLNQPSPGEKPVRVCARMHRHSLDSSGRRAFKNEEAGGLKERHLRSPGSVQS